jgi:hypothetical protein
MAGLLEDLQLNAAGISGHAGTARDDVGHTIASALAGPP